MRRPSRRIRSGAAKSEIDRRRLALGALNTVDGKVPRPAGRKAGASSGRLVREIAADLESLELLPFSDARAAFAPAAALERRAREAGAEDLEKRAQLVQGDVLGRIGKHTTRVEALEEQATLFASRGLFEKVYEQHIAFHDAHVALRAAEGESNSRTLQAVFETEEARYEGERFREMALRDALTGLRNRRYVDNELPVLISDVIIDGGGLAVGLLDIDHFKLVNDNYSHAIGDQVLCKLAEILTESTADGGLAARMGGEEFLVVHKDADVAGRFEKLRHRVESYPWDKVAPGLAVTVSIGAARLRPGRRTQAALLGQADRYLYAAKNTGRNRVVADPE